MARQRGTEFGFGQPVHRRRAMKRRMALPGLVASVALAICTAVAVTTVSIGIAKADAFGVIAESGGSAALAAVLGSAIACLGALTAAAIRRSAAGD